MRHLDVATRETSRGSVGQALSQSTDRFQLLSFGFQSRPHLFCIASCANTHAGIPARVATANLTTEEPAVYSMHLGVMRLSRYGEHNTSGIQPYGRALLRISEAT